MTRNTLKDKSYSITRNSNVLWSSYQNQKHAQKQCERQKKISLVIKFLLTTMV